MRFFTALFVCSASIMWADSATQREKLWGQWSAADSPAAEVAYILQQNGDSLHVVYSENGRKIAEFDCAATGRDCDFKHDGKHAKVSMWFNGPALVELETRGSEVVKRRFLAAESGDAIDVEITPVNPEGKPQKLHLRRAAAAAK